MSVLKRKPLEENLKPFSKYTLRDRLEFLAQKTGLDSAEIVEALEGAFQHIDLAETLIEAPVGYYALPLGLVKSLVVNGTDYSVPMAIEETSVVAAMNKTASWIQKNGSIKAWCEGRSIIGQIHIPNLERFDEFVRLVNSQKNRWIDFANEGPAHSLFKRGGGVIDIEPRVISNEKGSMGVIHVHLDPRDAMGANQVTQVCEFVKPFVEEETGEKVSLCILSNLTDTKITKAQVVLENIDLELARKIEEASHFAMADPYRAATHNKGVMNGIDAVLIATGNDWRAVEAALHAYAATKSKQGYRPLTTWLVEGNKLVGTFEGPIAVGVVGGATKVHPTAQFALQCLGNPSSNELAEIVASVGLVQNLGALRALVEEGIIQGHMGLQIKNILHNLKATPIQKQRVAEALKEKLKTQKHISESDATEILEGL